MKIIKNKKYYEQRTENSKIKKYSENKELIGIFDDIPREIISEYEKINIIKNFPEDYFDYEVNEDNEVTITKLKFPDICSSIEIPEKIKGKTVIGLGEKLFLANETIEYIKLPNTIKELGDYCFMAATNLREVTLSKNIKSIPKFCFHLCINLLDINVENISQIFSNAFSSSNVPNINLENVNFIGRDAFNNTKIKKLNLLNLTGAGEGIFAECSELEYVNIIGTLLEVPATMFFSCEKLKEVKLRSGMREIGQHAFTFCKELEKINLENIQIIREGAFLETKIKEKDIPKFSEISKINFDEER